MEKAIEFKKVRKGFKKGRKLLLKEALLDIFKPGKKEHFWALDGVSFDVKKGKTLGIIGPNGSGKSTILKLIAGVMIPDNGEVEVEGRVAPLIELGAGFHPELTGRENVYINGVILGLTKKQIEERFNDIVSFAELEEFIDTPVKHYSSGMYMRLGFAIAVNVNPDILLVDEVLAVGDTKFQEKCMKRMKEFQEENVTIVFVSHNLKQVENFCNEVIFLSDGKVKKGGDPGKVIGSYRENPKERFIR